MRLLVWFWVLCCLSISCSALHESDVGVADWYKQLIGVPQVTSHPKFVGKDITITATTSNVLAAISTKDGSIVWRYVFDPEDPIVGFYVNDGAVASLSGPGGAVARVFDVTTGDLLLEHTLHPNELGILLQPDILGKHVVFDSNTDDIYTLTNGYTVTRIDGKGSALWTWSSPDQTSKTIYIKLLSTQDALYVVGVTKGFSSYTLHIVALSPTTGEATQSREVPSAILNAVTDVFALTLQKHLVVWVEEGVVKTLSLDPTLSSEVTTIEITLAYLIDIGLNKVGQILGQLMNGNAKILELSPDGSSLATLHDFEGGRVGIYFASAIDDNGTTYVGQSHWSFDLNKVVLEVVGNGKTESYAIPFDTENEGVIENIAFQIGADNQPTIITTASSGAIQGFNATDIQWSRPESLASAVLAEFVELPERIATESGVNKTENVVDRLIRHAVEAQNFPQYLINFVRRFVTGSYASATSSAVPQSGDSLYRDTFGFRQVIVTATMYGKLFGIDSSNGNTLWTRMFGLGTAFIVGGTITPKKIYVLKTVSDGADPEVVIVAERRTPSNVVTTVLYHFNALNGQDLTGSSTKPEFLEAVDVADGSYVESFLLGQEEKVVIILDQSLQAHLYPKTSESQAAFNDVYARLSFPLRQQTQDGYKVVGHQFVIDSEADDEHAVAKPIWTLSLPDGEGVQTILPPAAKGPVASLGKVLGNRTTLYKYLNPRLFTALTATPTKNLCGVYVLDSAKGTTLYHAEVSAHNGACDIQAVLVENWLVYHYYESEAGSGNVKGTKGYRLISVEFYEGQGPDEKTRSSDMSSFSNATTDLTTFEESFIFPHAVSTVAPTSTKFSITSKDLIFATKNRKIQSFPRRFLDPRRPHGKPTTQELEEGLIQYDPIIPDDPKRVISHNYEVANVKQIVTAPAVLESTSMVFVFGLDIFLTRVAPSNTFDVLSENFNKAQLVITISALALAIAFTRPMVQRKRLREKWYQ